MTRLAFGITHGCLPHPSSPSESVETLEANGVAAAPPDGEASPIIISDAAAVSLPAYLRKQVTLKPFPEGGIASQPAEAQWVRRDKEPHDSLVALDRESTDDTIGISYKVHVGSQHLVAQSVQPDGVCARFQLFVWSIQSR